MKSSIRAIVTALSLLATVSTSHAGGPYGSISVGNWRGGAYTNDKTGAFANCAAGATYESGIYFMVSVNADLSWVLGFAQPDWQLKSGEAFPLALTFDGQNAVHVRGMPISAHLVGVAMPVNSSLIAQFRKAKTMTVFAQDQLFQFSLNQTAELLPSLVNCVVSVKKKGIGNATEFAVAKQPAPKPSSATAGPAPQ